MLRRLLILATVAATSLPAFAQTPSTDIPTAPVIGKGHLPAGVEEGHRPPPPPPEGDHHCPPPSPSQPNPDCKPPPPPPGGHPPHGEDKGTPPPRPEK